jgi:hypothetical protein
MATDKQFTVVGSSTLDGKTKVRFMNDSIRVKILEKNGHTNIDFINLPHAMSKVDAVRYMQSQNYGDGNLDIQAAMVYVLKKNKAVETAPAKPAVVEVNDAVPAPAASDFKVQDAPY